MATATKTGSKTVRKPKAAASKSVNPTLKTTTKKSLDAMSEAHRAKIERWEPMLTAIGAEHIWASSPRFRGRGEGPFYLAVKAGSKDYRIVSFDTSKPTVKAKVLVKGVTSPKTILTQFGEYRLMAKAERGTAEKPVAKSAPKTPAKAAAKKVVRRPAKAAAKAS